MYEVDTFSIIDAYFLGRKLYALVNNAAVFYHPHYLTENGFELTLQTNYLGKLCMVEIFRIQSIHALIIRMLFT